MSNGPRLSSAIDAMKYTRKPTAVSGIHHHCQRPTTVVGWREPASSTTESTDSVLGSSSEIICAAPRTPPSVAYVLPDDHAPSRMPRTATDGTARKNTTPTLVSSGAQPATNGM